MKNILLMALLGIISLPVNAKPFLQQQDKQKHIVGTALIVGISYTITHDLNKSIIIGAGVGIAKELHDSRNGGSGFSTQDLAADAIGLGLGTIGIKYIYKF
jgi:uncharacterized protein YfiM (DUF2279 family)